MLPRGISVALFVAVLFLSSAQNVYTQGSAPAEPPSSSNGQTELQVLRALLDEVRQLRGALQRNSFLQHHSNLLFERLRRQGDLITRFERELQELRQDMRELSDNGRYEEQNEDLKQLETELGQAVDPTQRADLAVEYGRVSRSLERHKKADAEELARKREREPKLEERIRLENATLLDLYSQLEAFERDIDLQTIEALKTSGPQQ